MYSCIIIDDERNARETLQKIINRYFSARLTVSHLAESVRDGVAAIHKFKPDIVFLDIEMPDEDGFALFEYFHKFDFEVIFTTAYKHYAINAIRYAALDYLLKPINFIDLKEALDRFEQKHQQISKQIRVEALLNNLSGSTAFNHKVALPTANGYQLERINNILYCQADQSYCYIFTLTGESIVISKTLKFIEEILPPELFFRIHKSYLVNLNYIKTYNKVERHFVVMDNGTKLEVATRRTEEFERALTKRK